MEPLQQFSVDGSNMNFPQIQFIPDVASSSLSKPQPPPTNSNSALSGLHPNPSIIAVPAPAPPRLPEHLMHKNRLQEFTQRSNIALPMYQTSNEGTPHAPRFRSTVCVDGVSYTSPVTFSQRKAAEQDVARLALENLMKRVKDEECPLNFENALVFPKSILNEYATKLSVERPTYDTVQLEGVLPLFQSSIAFNGTKYTGDAARNKKEAEQLAARATILSILGGSSPAILCEIIKSKSKIYAAAQPNKSQCTDANIIPAIASTGQTSSLPGHKDKEVVASLVACNSDVPKIELPQMPVYVPAPRVTKLSNITPSSCREATQIQAAANNDVPKIELPQIPVYVPAPEVTKLSNITPSSCQEATQIQAAANNDVPKIELPQMPVYVPAPEVTKLSNITPSCQEATQIQAAEATQLPNISLQPGGSEQQQNIANASSSKKRRKNKKKTNKKSRLESPLPQVVIPCSVTQ